MNLRMKGVEEDPYHAVSKPRSSADVRLTQM